MTIQIRDSVTFEGFVWDVVHSQPQDVAPRNEELGIVPYATSSACWRGRVDNFAVDDDKLVLTSVDYAPKEGTATLGKPFRVFALPGARRIGWNPGRRLEFTGTLVIARERARSTWEDRYRQDANTYLFRIILQLDGGRIESANHEFGASDVPWGENPEQYRAERRRLRVEAEKSELRRAEEANARKAAQLELHALHDAQVRARSAVIVAANQNAKDGDVVAGECPLCATVGNIRVMEGGLVLCFKCYFKW